MIIKYSIVDNPVPKLQFSSHKLLTSHCSYNTYSEKLKMAEQISLKVEIFQAKRTNKDLNRTGRLLPTRITYSFVPS